MHPKVSIFTTNLSKLTMFRPLSNLERREGFGEDYVVTANQVLTHGESLLTDSDVPKDEMDVVKVIHHGARYLRDLIIKYQQDQLQNNTNLFTNEPANVLLVGLHAIPLFHELSPFGSKILASIYNMRGLIQKNQSKKEDAKASFVEALRWVTQGGIEESVIKINLANLYDAASEKNMLQEAVDQLAMQETAMASVYVAQALRLRKENDRTPTGIEKIDSLFRKAYTLFPESNIVRNNWALYLCDEDEFDPFARSFNELSHAAEIFKEVIASDPQRHLIVAPTYLAVTYYKLAGQYAKSDKNKAAQFHDYCLDTLEKCRKIIANDEMAEIKQQPFQYDAKYREEKRQHFSKIESALMTLGVGPKPILNRYHTTMPQPTGVIQIASLQREVASAKPAM
jgi:hypothetical protein